MGGQILVTYMWSPGAHLYFKIFGTADQFFMPETKFHEYIQRTLSCAIYSQNIRDDLYPIHIRRNVFPMLFPTSLVPQLESGLRAEAEK